MPVVDLRYAMSQMLAGGPIELATLVSGSGNIINAAASGGRRDERRVILTSFFFQAEDGIRDDLVTGVQTCALPILITRKDVATPFPAGVDPNAAIGEALQSPEAVFAGNGVATSFRVITNLGRVVGSRDRKSVV